MSSFDTEKRGMDRTNVCRLVLLVGGLPGSGKSTITKLVSNQLDEMGTGCTILEFDAFLHRRLLAKMAADVPPSEVDKKASEMFSAEEWHAAKQELFAALKEAMVAGMSTGTQAEGGPLRSVIFIVDNFHHPSMRLDVWRAVRDINSSLADNVHAAQGQGWGVATAGVDAPVEDCVARNRGRVGLARVPDTLIESMGSSSDWSPVPRAGCPHLHVDAGLTHTPQSSSTMLIEAVLGCLRKVSIPLVAIDDKGDSDADHGGSDSPKHQIELILRREVALIMRRLPANTPKTAGKQLSQAKTRVQKWLEKEVGCFRSEEGGDGAQVAVPDIALAAVSELHRIADALLQPQDAP